MSDKVGLDRLKLELRRATVPGLLFLGLCVAGLFTAVNIVRNLAGDKPWVDYVQYKVAFDNVEGVVPGRHELRIAGVKAGSIADSRLEHGHPVLVLKVEKKYAPLHTNAKVVIRPVTALEDMYVDIVSRGTKSAPVLQASATLPATRTKSMVEVGRVLNVLDEDTRPRLATLLTQLARGTDDRGERMRQAFAQLGPFLEVATQLGDTLNGRRASLARLVHNFGNVTEVLATRDRQLAGFVDQGSKTLATLAQHDRSLSATIGQLPGTLGELRTTFANVRRTETTLDSALRSLRPVAKALPSGLDSLSAFSKDATPAIRSLRPAMRSLVPLAQELPNTAATGERALAPLAKQAKQLDHGTTLLQPCLPLVSTFLNRLNSLLKFGDGGYVPDARASVIVDFHTPLELLKDPDWRIAPPCFKDPEAAYRANGPQTKRLPSRDDAESKESAR
ncbi:MCE-family protein Mce6D [Patulibacter medicamentivorans]|uniref:MCE-family protein Mce6D n=1 Tax=Patulibacter medicamentivorans TaxID=1097667 RepID=H0E5N8_9ACTN|nr:MCE family protein [Patulibacter medicamentivorans]EHN11001.1 MCE-family protein Mce6D [Patulibacter medicamentivorans]